MYNYFVCVVCMKNDITFKTLTYMYTSLVVVLIVSFVLCVILSSNLFMYTDPHVVAIVYSFNDFKCDKQTTQIHNY